MDTKQAAALFEADVKLKIKSDFQFLKAHNLKPKVFANVNKNFLSTNSAAPQIFEFCASDEAFVSHLITKLKGNQIEIYESIDGEKSLKTDSLLQTNTYYFSNSINGIGSPRVKIQVIVKPLILPDFPTTQTICKGAKVKSLPEVSPNGVKGKWFPEIINAEKSGIYVFTPLHGECALPITFVVTVNSLLTPIFNINLSIDFGSKVPVLDTLSLNGISGTWSPAIINSEKSGSYIFTPYSSQCAETVSVNVLVHPKLNTENFF